MDAQLIQFHITPQLADQAANGIQNGAQQWL